MEIHTITLESWMCRICLERGVYNIFDDRLFYQQGQPPTASSNCNNSISIIEALNYFGEFKIFKPITIDEPIMLCESCHSDLARCVDFRRKLHESEILLHKGYPTIIDTDDEFEEGKTGLTMHMVDIEPFLEKDEPETSETVQGPPKQTKTHYAKPRFKLTSQVSNILRHVATTSSNCDTNNSEISLKKKRKESDDPSSSATPKKIHRRDSQENTLEKTLIVPKYIFTREVDNQQEKNVLIVDKALISPKAGSFPSEDDLDRSDTDEIFYCKHCPKAFSTRYHLIIHNKNVHLCQYCLKYFATILARNKHVREEHKSFRCSLCTFQSRYATNLRAHLRKMHSVALPAHVSILQPLDVAGNK